IGNTGGTFAWTPGFAQSGSYPVTFAAQAGAGVSSLTTLITVSNEDRAPLVVAPTVVDGEEGGVLLFDVTASDPDGDALDNLGADLSALPAGHGATFTPAAGFASGTFRWPMLHGEAGSYLVAFTASNGSSGSAVTRINVAFAGTTVTGELIWTPQPGEEGTYVVTFSATNNLNEVGSAQTTIIVTSAPSVTAPETNGRTIILAPEAPTKGPIVSVSGLVSVGTKSTTTISATATEDTSVLLARSLDRVNAAGAVTKAASGIVTFDADRSGLPEGNNSVWIVDQEPVVVAPTSFTINPGDALSFSVGSSDPDGDPLLGLTANLTVLPAGNTASFTANGSFTSGSFSWTPRPEDAGTFAIEFTAFNALVGKATTSVTVRAVAPARVFLAGSKKIRLSSNRPFGCLQIEPVNGAFTLFDIDLTSIRMVSIGTGSVSEIAVNSTKTAVIGDRDGNQIDDVQVCFSKADFRALFSLLRGSNSVPVIVRGRLTSGANFQGSVTLEILAGGGVLQTVMSPNPLNPSGMLSFITKTPGAVRVSLFDLQGRFLRTIWERQSAAPGAHEVPVEARGAGGRTLSSGVYFFRIESSDGVDTGRFTVLK
ncbi:MAG: Ig-like domain-containing protein, partial [Candidatus Eisenbacteria bacterium]